MKKQLLAITLGATALLWSNDALSYLHPDDVNGMSQGNNGNAVSATAKGANCSPATARLTMEFNDVSAFIEQGGSMFQNRQDGTAAYEIPKGSGLKAIYAGALWMGGTDVNGQLKLAAIRYRQGNDFWAGPLSVTPGTGNYNPNQPVGDDAVRPFGGANIDPDQCTAYDEFYTIRKAEVIQFNIWWECNNGVATEGCDEVQQPSADILNRIYAWPAHGDVSLEQDFYLAPFYDRDGDGNYDPVGQGDYPWYDDILGRDDIICGVDRRISLFGDETHWWVFNDKGNIHTETGGDPIGMEIRAQAFAFATTDEVNRMTFYNYELINRGTQTLFNTYFSQYLDADIGNFNDDYAGCDVSRGLGYMFNGDLNDETNGAPGYGENPPAIGCDFFEGPYQDADQKDNIGPYIFYDSVADTSALITPSVLEAINDDGIVYQGIGVGYSDNIIDNERYGMRGFTYYTSTAASTQSDPTSAAQYYNYMSGLWRFGEETVYGGTGFPGSTGATPIASDYMFPGDSDPLNWATEGVDPGFLWDEATDNNPAGDRRFVQSAGPFTLTPGAVNNITVGIVYGRGTEGNLFSSVDAMKRADTKAQALFDACFAILTPPDAPKLTIQELENQLVLTLENPVTSNNYLEGYAEEDKVNITDPTVDRVYTFEGYQIFQLLDDATGVADIEDPEKARLVAQCDIENDIERIINFEFDEELGFAVPIEKVDGANEGIRHSFLITEDAFAQGERALVNHKTYYYVAVAYAHNEFKKYDPTDALLLDGQKIPYISSRLSFDGTAIKSVAAVPHNPTPEADGTGQNIAYGSSPIITRLDGYGNGGNDLALTQESKDLIVANGQLATPSYDYGRGPLNVKVIDPLNVVDGYFECRFRDYSIPVTFNDCEEASWVIYRYDQEGGTIIDSVSSEFIIRQNNEQLIPQWGISVQIHHKPYFITDLGSGLVERYSTDLIRASIEYTDSSQQWLSGVEDNDAFFPTNWIRSGDYTPEDDPNDPNYECDPNALSYLDPCSYKDQAGGDNDKVYAGILDGIIAPHKLVGYQADFMPLAYYNTNTVASVKNSASISYLPGIDIVLTNDRSKWTRCPVIELGRDVSLNVGGAEPGQLRQSPSVDKFGNDDGTGTGMGWFPGYAIDIESGVRLYMAFGENSFLGNENGADMVWNPTDRLLAEGVGALGTPGIPIMGGMHPVYVWGHNFKSIHGDPFGSAVDFPAYIPGASNSESNAGNELFNQYALMDANNQAAAKFVYSSLAWIAYPMAAPGYDITNGFPTDVEIELRVNKEYKNYVATGANGGRPMYSWNMDDIATTVGSEDKLAEALEMINVVPNPYYAYSEYERTRLDTRVKITNLPERCTVRIYSVNGKLVRTFKKDSPVTSVDWDLNNWKAIPVAGGVYLIHVEIPGVGEKVLKFFGGMRQVDLQGI